MRVLLVSSYELGHQPLHVAAPAAKLEAGGHEVRVTDLGVDPLLPEDLAWAEVVALSVPMHTAMRLAVAAARRVRALRPEVPIAFYGLYATVGADRILGDIADRLIAGEYEDDLVAWVASLAGGDRPGSAVRVELGRSQFLRPARHLLAPLDRYARLQVLGEERLAGYVEASHGCRHRCAHCPVPAVYDGRYRITGVETVLADVAQLVEAGASHITIGDPDFLNAPPYALDVLDRVAGRFPHLTFDVTVKVEHILAHPSAWPRMAERGVIFVTTAAESLDDAILAILDKGHTASEVGQAVAMVRGSGIDVHPTWLPFTPWTTLDGVAEIARFVWEQDLAPVTDPVQLSIRLLVPENSLLLEVAEMLPYLGEYDADNLGYRWSAADPEVDHLAWALAVRAADDADAEVDPVQTLAAMTDMIAEASGTTIPTSPEAPPRARLSEPWFCCAEPTGAQLTRGEL